MRKLTLSVLGAALAVGGVAIAQDAPEGAEEAAEPEPEPEPAPTVTYTLSGDLYVQVFKDPDTLGASLSHDHVVRATGWSGTATWNADDVSQCDVKIQLPVNGLVPDEDNWRSMLGLEGTLDDGMREDVKENMLGADQLNAGKYSKISYQSSSCAASGDRVNVSGTLTVHGVGKSLSVPMTITADGSNFSAKGSFKANATDFGFEPYSAGFGALKNLNQMKFGIDVKGAAQ